MALLHPTPNHINALAIKLFEYMGAGLPIICSNFSLWKEIIEKGKCGICVAPLNLEEIAVKVRYLLENPKIAKQMGENGKALVHKYYNWESEKNILLLMYKEILGEN